MEDQDRFDPQEWCEQELAERRRRLVEALQRELNGVEGLDGVSIELGPVGREYDLTAVAETDVGRLRTPLWSHGRATIFCDPSVHPANRAQFSPGPAVETAADSLRRRLNVPYRLESRGLTADLEPEDGVRRTWTAEHSTFRKRTMVTREDRVERPGELDVRDLFAHFYTGPSIRLVSAEGDPFMLGPATDAEGPLVTLCHSCHTWAEGGAATECPSCGSAAVDVVVAAPARGSRR